MISNRSNSQRSNVHQRKHRLEEWQKWLATYGQYQQEPVRQGDKIHRRTKITVKTPSAETSIKKKEQRSLSVRLKSLANTVNTTQFIGTPTRKGLARDSAKPIGRSQSQQSIELILAKSSKTKADSESSTELHQVECETALSSQGLLTVRSSNAIHLLSTYRDIQERELEKIITWKQAEIQLLQKQSKFQKERLLEEIGRLGQQNTEYARTNKQLTESQNNLQLSVNKLQCQIEGYKQQLKKTKEEVSFTRASSGVRVECQCNKLKACCEDNIYQLKKAKKLNAEYEGMICDLHLQNRLYRNHLDKCGHSRAREFVQAEKKLIRAQDNRKRM